LIHRNEIDDEIELKPNEIELEIELIHEWIEQNLHPNEISGTGWVVVLIFNSCVLLVIDSLWNLWVLGFWNHGLGIESMMLFMMMMLLLVFFVKFMSFGIVDVLLLIFVHDEIYDFWLLMCSWWCCCSSSWCSWKFVFFFGSVVWWGLGFVGMLWF
jgi:hypothetical protein